jgi:membrane protein YqaA with SNARE-associated domain
LKAIAEHLFVIFTHLGGVGLLLLGVLDSSFLLFVPLGNDLLIIAMSAKKHSFMPYYAAMAAAGSLLGCALTDAVARRGGEKGLGNHVPAKRLEYVKKQVKSNAAWALSFAALMPPPFPFTAFVAAAAALQYPRKKLLAMVGASRLVRFSIEGTLAILMGKRLFRLARTRTFEDAVVFLMAVSIVGSIVSVYTWVWRSRAGRARRTPSKRPATS